MQKDSVMLGHYGSLNRNGLHRTMRLNACPMESATIKRCVLVAAGVAFLEEVCHCGGGFEVSYGQAMPSVGHSSHFAACGSRCKTLSSFSSTVSACTAVSSAMITD